MSGLYTNYKNLLLGNGVHTLPDWDTDTMKVGIVSGADYAENLSTDQDWNDVGTYGLDTCYNGEATQTLNNVSISGGSVDNTADITFTAVAIDGVKDIDAVVHYRSSGVVTTDTLACFHDGFAAVTPNGGDIVLQYNVSGLFSF